MNEMKSHDGTQLFGILRRVIHRGPHGSIIRSVIRSVIRPVVLEPLHVLILVLEAIEIHGHSPGRLVGELVYQGEYDRMSGGYKHLGALRGERQEDAGGQHVEKNGGVDEHKEMVHVCILYREKIFNGTCR